MTTTNVVDTAKKLWTSKDEIAKNIWLAGLGAYGKSIDEANKASVTASEKSSALFEELVAKGAEIEESAKAKLTAKKATLTAKKATLSDKKITTDVLEARVNQVFTKISGVDATKVDTLNAKVDELTKAIAELKK